MQNLFKQIRSSILFYDDGTLPNDTLSQMRVILVSIFFGAAWVAVTSGTAFTGYLKAIGASDFVLSVLLAIPFALRTVQLLASYILERSRKRIQLLTGVGLISRLLWVPIAFVPLFVPMEQTSLRLWLILVLYALSSGSGVFIDSAYLSLAADVVPLRIRGRFFSLRSRLNMFASIFAGLIAGYVLDYVTGTDGLLGYIICISVAGVLGAADIACFLTTKFPPMPEPDAAEIKNTQSFPSMIKEVLKNKPFMKLVGYWTLWSLLAYLMTPFYNVFMLEYVKMSFSEIFIFCNIPANITAFLFLSRWGRVMDEYGYKPVLFICTILTGITPLLWTFSYEGNLLFVTLSQLIAGAFFYPIDLSGQNTIMNAAPNRNRSMYTAIYMVITQLLGISVSYVVGGFLLDNVFSPMADYCQSMGISYLGHPITQYHFLLIITTIGRLSCAIAILKSSVFDSTMPLRQVYATMLRSMTRSLKRQYKRYRAYQVQKKARRRIDQ